METPTELVSHNGEFFLMLAYAWDLFKKNPYLYIGLGLVSIIISVVPVVSYFSAFFTIGFSNCCYKLMKNETIEFKYFFFSFQSFSRFLNILVALLIWALVTVLAYILLIIPGIYITVALYFTTTVMVVENIVGIESLKRSKELVSGRWWNAFGFCGFLLLLNIVGALCLVIGLFVTIPLTAILSLVYYDHLVQTKS